MNRIAVVGNSHVAALALGWRELEAERPGCSLTFFAAPRTLINGLEPRGGDLVARDPDLRKSLVATSGGPPRIVAADYDRFILCGMGFGLRRLMAIYTEYSSEEMAISPARQPVSDACFVAAVRGSLRGSGLVELAGKLRQLTDNPIDIIPEPNPSNEIYEIPSPVHAGWNLASETDEREIIAALFEEAARDALPDLQVVPTPPSSRFDVITSRAEFSRGSVRLTDNLDVAHGNDDVFHMNGKYGRIVLDSLLAA